MRARLGSTLTLAARVLVVSAPLVACNALSGVLDLEVGDDASAPFDAGIRVEGMDGASPPPGEGGLRDANADAQVDAADSGCVSTPSAILGGVKPLPPFFELTPNQNAMAGGLASATEMSLDDFDASFMYSITYTSMDTPGSGIALFAIASLEKDLGCQPGPALCTLNARSQGFAVILRTSKANAGDPEVPYLAVVDAKTFPSQQPASPTLISTDKAGTLVPSIVAGVPPATTFHTMAVAAHQGVVSASIDGAVILNAAPIPSWTKGRTGTWGVAASTGLGTAYAERTVVGNVSFRQCPP